MDGDMLAAFHNYLERLEPKKLDEDATVVPVGLEFGPSWITTVFSIKEGPGEYFTGYPCGQVYRDFYQEALRQKVQQHLRFREFLQPCAPLVATEERAAELVEVFAREIDNARRMGVRAMDNDPKFDFKVLAITVPDHWDTSARTVVARAAELAGQNLDGSHMMLKYPRAVQSAYAMARNSEGEYLTLLVHHNKTYLHLMLVRMCDTDCVMQGEVCLPQLGEEALLSAVAHDKEDDKEGLESMDPENEASSDEPTSTKTTDKDKETLKETDREDKTSNEATSTKTTEYKLHEEEPDNDRNAPKFPVGTAVVISSDDNHIKRPAHQDPHIDWKPIQDSIKEFLILMTEPNTSSAPPPSQQPLKDAARNLKHIFTGGEASMSFQNAIETGVEELFADMDWIKIHKGSMGYCGARGAEIAARGREWEELPEYVRMQEEL